ncbi:nucleotidyltransferase family protein [Brevundimonas sp.]|uniref:nucleotidyltransferase family protein n=1 Tax=Brevundimonas sp. TaxID=1871086 RepID=UPI002730D5A3|nr:nucleotidyltransferase domain-containing protein [Brevundimonas sp.]MDP1912182.1 nucleotidyltransferase domain-containing protein [Brevundimonas sp.]
MLVDLEVHRDDVSRLCRLHGVTSLDVFGSATGDAFDPARSDIDFIVDFGPQAQPRLFEHYFALKLALEVLFGRQVDLVMAGAMTNPYFIESAQRTRRPVYASPLPQAA